MEKPSTYAYCRIMCVSPANTDGVFEAFVVSIEVCYRLVGQVRLHWQGFQGGDRAWREIEGFFTGLRALARPLAAEARA